MKFHKNKKKQTFNVEYNVGKQIFVEKYIFQIFSCFIVQKCPDARIQIFVLALNVNADGFQVTKMKDVGSFGEI